MNNVARVVEEVIKHLPNRHDQKAHGGDFGKGGGGGDGVETDDEFVDSLDSSLTSEAKAKGRKLFVGQWPEPTRSQRSVEITRPSGVRVRLLLDQYHDTTTQEVMADQNHQKMNYYLKLLIYRPDKKYPIVLNVGKRTVSNKSYLDSANHAKAKQSLLNLAKKDFVVKFDPYNLDTIGW